MIIYFETHYTFGDKKSTIFKNIKIDDPNYLAPSFNSNGVWGYITHDLINYTAMEQTWINTDKYKYTKYDPHVNYVLNSILRKKKLNKLLNKIKDNI